MNQIKSQIKALTYVLPSKKVSNDDLQKTFDNQIVPGDFERLGIKNRFIIDKDVKASDLAFDAAVKLISENKIDKNEIDALIYCSAHHDYITPQTSCVLHGRLGLGENVATFDLTHGCSGYVYGLFLAKSLIEGSGMKKILFLTGSTLSQYLHPKDKASLMVFGDGGSATLICAEEKGDSAIGNFIMRTDGKGMEKIIIRDGGDRNHITERSHIEKTDSYNNVYSDSTFFMDGISVFLFTLKKVPSLIEDTLKKNDLTKDDIDLYILHQANIFINEQIRKKLRISPERFFHYVENCGNTVHSTIPIALLEAIKAGKAKKGNKILLAGFGVGLSWGATVITL